MDFRWSARGLQAACCVALLLPLNGCGKEMVFHQVHGTVSLDGKPVRYGEMNVDPLSNAPNSGRSMIGRVFDGKYDLRPTGVAEGEADFTITVVDLGTYEIRDPENVTPAEDSKIMAAKKLVFHEKIKIDRDEINIELKSENGEKFDPRGAR